MMMMMMIDRSHIGGALDDDHDANEGDSSRPTSNLTWNSVNSYVACPIQSWKGSLPASPETPYSPYTYLRKLWDANILEKVAWWSSG